MCLICKREFKFSLIGDYRRCEYCKTYIANVTPNDKRVQKTLEEHAISYILGSQDSSDSVIHQARLTEIKKFSKKAKTILDFGCGRGDFVIFLLKKEYKAFAYDKSYTLKKYLVAQNIPVFDKVRDIPDKYFDVITCYDVIEHTTNPRLLLESIKGKLRDGGILVVSTPNARGFSATILRKRWWVFGPAAHYILFSPYSLRFLLTSMGYRILKIRTDTLTPWFIPSERLWAKLLNKVIYLITYPFHTLLFNNCLGDNIVAMVRL